MFKNLIDISMLAVLGFVKGTLFLLLLTAAIFLFVKTKAPDVKDHTNYLGLVKPPTENLEIQATGRLTNDDIEVLKDDLEHIEDMSVEEAEIFLFILRFSDSIAPANARSLAKTILEECEQYDLDPYLILAVIQVESKFTPGAVSNKGAVGLMQVMPKTAEYTAKQMGMSYKGSKTLHDPLVNVKLGIHYLSRLSDRFQSTEGALAAYNYGPAGYIKLMSSNQKLPRYVKKVLSFKSFLEEERAITQSS